MIPTTTTTTKLFLAALALAGCGTAAPTADPPPTGGGTSCPYTTHTDGGGAGEGGSGAGGTSSAGATGGAGASTSSSSGGATPCDPEKPTEAFEGYHGCWEVECCSGVNPGTQDEMNYQCTLATNGMLPDAYFCAMEPTFGPQTDYRECSVITVQGWENATCQWGTNIILCCEAK